MRAQSGDDDALRREGDDRLPEITDEIEAWAKEGGCASRRKLYEDADLDGASIVIASTDDQSVNGRVARDSRRRQIPVNVVDVTHLCEFIVPAIVESGSIQIASRPAGNRRLLARTLKEDLQQFVGPEYPELNDLLGTLRAEAQARAADRHRSQALLRRHHRRAESSQMLREGRRTRSDR